MTQSRTTKKIAMRRTGGKALAALITAAALVGAGPATSATAEDNVNLYTGDGDTLRAMLYEHYNFGGHIITYKGSSSCSTTLSDLDARFSSMPGSFINSWDNSVGSIRDFNSCDIRLWPDKNFGGTPSPWFNGAQGNLGIWDDRASSWAVS
jgi:hypothetical protein